MTRTTSAARHGALRPALTFAGLILGLMALFLLFDDRLRDHLETVAGRAERRIVHFETAPLGAAVSGGETGYLALRFRIGIRGERQAAALAARLPQAEGALLQAFAREPIRVAPGGGRLDLAAIEARARDLLDGMLGASAVAEVRVVDVRRRPI